jgi:RNA 2',3'-cyclic 3'-phosphodiesterase
MRLFVAVDLAPPDLLGGIAGRIPRHFHATLRFFDDVPAAAVAGLIEAITEVARESPSFELELLGVGAFPTVQNPRVVWVGFGRGRASIEGLAGRIESSLRGRGFPPELRSFQPHATLARVRNPRERDAAQQLLERGARISFGVQRVEEIVLYESRLDASGADHHRLAAARLRRPE